ncbi:hypothetical protein Sjap_001725 [Stephania japonica]|uniref:Uncharacterized protein n=1 Tax=Stephania japonica TaxID=461633 RepID=A0AAP0KN19_9MAGN
MEVLEGANLSGEIGECVEVEVEEVVVLEEAGLSGEIGECAKVEEEEVEDHIVEENNDMVSLNEEWEEANTKRNKGSTNGAINLNARTQNVVCKSEELVLPILVTDTTEWIENLDSQEFSGFDASERRLGVELQGLTSRGRRHDQQGHDVTHIRVGQRASFPRRGDAAQANGCYGVPAA